MKKPLDEHNEKTYFVRRMANTSKDQQADQQRADGMAYPLFTLSGCIRVAEAVRDLGGVNQEISKELLASRLNASEKSSTFQQRMASAKVYGMIEGRGAYRLTDAAKRYFYPASNSEKLNAGLSFLSAVSVFNEVIKRFDGSPLPNQDLLANILHRDYGVSKSWKDRVAGFFAGSAQYVGALDSQGYLRFKAAQHANPVSQPVNPGREPAPVGSQVNQQPLSPRNPPAEDTNVWNFSFKGENVRLETPPELSKPLWEKLNSYVQLLKPSDDAGPTLTE